MANQQSEASSKYFAQFTAFISMAFGAFVFAGWLFDLDPLTNIVPGMPRISRITALGFLTAGVAQWLCTLAKPRAAAAVSLFLAGVGLLVLLRYALSWDVYIDQFSLAPIPITEFGPQPPRMA